MNTPPSILVIGSANMDLAARVQRLPHPGETLHAGPLIQSPGGKGANQALAAARLGGRVRFVGRIGDDAFGNDLAEGLDSAGVDITLLDTVQDAATGTALILIDDEGESTIVVSPGANFALSPDDIRTLTPIIEAADCVLLQLEIPLPVVETALRIAREVGTPTFLDCGPAQALPPEILALATVVSPNETETEALCGIKIENVDKARAAAQVLHEAGAGQVVLKLGALGALAFDGYETIHVPAFPVAVVDTTAAGDAFTAALALRWASHKAREALAFANAAGALTVTKAGAQTSLPSLAEVEAFLAKNKGDQALSGDG